MPNKLLKPSLLNALTFYLKFQSRLMSLLTTS